MAPEVFRNEEYDTKVDVFSFSLILKEVSFLHFSIELLSIFFPIFVSYDWHVGVVL